MTSKRKTQLIHQVSHEDLKSALHAIEQEQVEISSVDGTGIICGWVEHHGNRIPCQVGFTMDGELAAEENPDGSSFAHELALALSLMRQLHLKGKNSSGSKKVNLKALPVWLNNRYRLSVSVQSWASDLNFQEVPPALKSLQDLQAYWELLRMAHSAKASLPSELIVKHLMGIYGQERWILQRHAMEALLRRITSAVKEELLISQKPKGRQVLGEYTIKRKGDQAKPYRVLLNDNQGIQGSCSCKDFQKSTLGLCKHLATVLIHWHSSEKELKEWQKNHSREAQHHIGWDIETGLDTIVSPLQNIQILPQGDNKLDRRSLGRFFATSPSNGSHPFVLPKEPEKRIKTLKRFQDAIVKENLTISIDPVIEPIISKAIQDLEWPLKFEKNKKRLLGPIKKIKYKLYPYQKEGVLKALSKGKFLLGDDMGLGKTVQAITWTECLLQTKEAKAALIICPAGLKTQWQREWLAISGRETQVVVGSPDQRQDMYEKAQQTKQPTVLILNYELVRRDLEALKVLNPQAIVLDEAQRIKNYSTQTAITIKSLTPPFRLILTGTPMENRIQELSSLMDWIDDHAMGPAWRLEAETSLSGDGHGHGPKGVRGLKRIRERLEPHFLRRLRKDVLEDLPSRTDSSIVVPCTEEQKIIHDDLAGRVAKLMAITNSRPLKPEEHLRLMSLLTQMRIVSNALAQFEFELIWDSLKNDPRPEQRLPQLHSPKLGEFRDIIRGLLSQDDVKIVVFSQWQRMLRLNHWAIHDLLKELEVEAVFFTGKENQKRRTENVIRFHDDPNVRIFFASDAGGVGLNLQKAASVCLNLELPWNPAVLEQRIGRVYRLGQKKPVQVYNLITQDSIEERITALVGQKKAVFNELFDGTSDEVHYEENSSFYEQVQSVMKQLNPSMETIDSESDEDELLDREIDILNDDIEVPEEKTASPTEELPTQTEPSTQTESSQEPENPESMTPAKGNEEYATANNDVPQPTSAPKAEDVFNAFRNIKMEKTASGTLKIEASGDSAKLLAGLFRGMADLFDS